MPSPRRAVFLDHQSLDLGDLDLSPLQQQFDQFGLFAATAPEQVAERLQGAVAVVSNKVVLDAAVLAANP